MFKSNLLLTTAFAAAIALSASGVNSSASAQEPLWGSGTQGNVSIYTDDVEGAKQHAVDTAAEYIGTVIEFSALVVGSQGNPNPAEDDGKVEPNLEAVKDLVKEQDSGEVPVDFWKTQFGKDLTKKGKGNPINPVHNPGVDNPNGGLSVDVNGYDPFDARKEFEAHVEEARDLIDQATQHDVEDREDVERTLGEMMGSENAHAGLMEQVMPSNEEDDDNSAKQDDIERVSEMVEEEDDLTGPPERVNPDPTTRVFGSAVAARMAKRGANKSSSTQVNHSTARGFSIGFGARAAKLSISKAFPRHIEKRIDNHTERGLGSAFSTRAAKPGVAKPIEKQIENNIEKSIGKQTAVPARASLDTRAAKPGVAKTSPRQIERFAVRAMTR